MIAKREYNEDVQLVTQVQAEPSEPQVLLLIIQRFNYACNWLSDIAFQEKLFHWLPLQRRAYHELRQRFSLSSAEALIAIRKVAYAYKDRKRRNTQATFRPLGAIPLHRHSYKRDGSVAFYGYRCPIQFRQGVELSGKHQATLSYDKTSRKFYIHQVIEVETPGTYQPQDFLGCDLGIVNVLADSDGLLYAGGQVNGLRKRHAKLRTRLQSKGTKSAKRLLTHRSRKEGRFSRWVNHNISKKVVQKAKDTLRGIALEELGGIRERITGIRKAQRRIHHSWSFNQLRQFITYKSKLAGTPLMLVDPRNTSRTCPECGNVDKLNRVSQSEFRCRACGFSGNADIIAAVNIGRRAVGNQPNGASQDSPKSQEVLLGLKG